MNKIAVIDIGSNSVRLMMLADGKVLYKTIKTTRLGEGLAFSPLLKSEAIERTISAMQEFLTKARDEGSQSVYAFATAAVRSAENRAEFLKQAKTRLSLNVEVISGETEAEIGILGAIGLSDGGIIDVGGASTEFILQRQGKIVYEKSLDVGVVRVKDACGRNQKLVEQFVSDVVKEYGTPEIKEKIYAIGGTATSLAAIANGLKEYKAEKVTGTVLTKSKMQEMTDKLFSMSVEEIRQIPCIDRLRADVLAGGAAILTSVMSQLKIEEITVSDGDNLEGYAILKGLL